MMTVTASDVVSVGRQHERECVQDGRAGPWLRDRVLESGGCD